MIKRLTSLLRPRASASAGGRRRWIWLLAITLLALIGIRGTTVLREHRMAATSAGEAALRQKALEVEEELRRALLVDDQTLRLLAVAWARDPAGFALGALRDQMVALQADTLQVFIADTHGIVRQSTGPGIVGNDVSTRDYFQHERDTSRPDGRMFISAPVQGLTTRRWQLNLARRLDNPDGSFGGVVAISLPAEAFAFLSHLADLDERDALVLVSRPDGGLLATASGAPQAGSIAGSPLLDTIQSSSEGFWTGTILADGVRRRFAFIAVPDRTLSVLVGEAAENLTEPDRVWRLGAELVMATVVLSVLAGTVTLQRALKEFARREQGLARDREVLRAANAALEAARADAQIKARRLQVALAGMTDGIMILDSELRLVEWNDKVAGFTGIPDGVMREGKPMREILLAQARAGEFGAVDPEAETERRMALLHGITGTSVVERVRPNGRVVEIRRNPLQDDGLVTLYTDITERRLAGERLRAEQTMAAVGRLTAGLAHDFNNLLAAISLNADMIALEINEGSPLHQRVETIMKATGKGAAMVSQLLAFARRQKLDAQMVDINATITGLRDILVSMAGAAIAVVTDLSHESCLVMVDRVQLENVILNLVINARDAMPDGGSISIRSLIETLKPEAGLHALPPGEYVVIAVSDTGTGMTEAVRSQAFDPFFTTKADGRGSGLGLSQVYGVTRQSGGIAEIISAPGAGTTIRIVLPRVHGAE